VTERELTIGVLGVKPAGDQTHDVFSDPSAAGGGGSDRAQSSAE
jgi:hypothetical protein